MAQHVSCTWRGFEAIHRFEDLALIAEVLVERCPLWVVELGTAGGGFAAFLADTVHPWGGRVLTVDLSPDAYPGVAGRLRKAFSNVRPVFGDALAGRLPLVDQWLACARSLLYCDNGDKELELRRYALGYSRFFLPYGGSPETVGTHDYGTEVDPGRAESLMDERGYRPYRHADFAALAHPEWYPDSLTRFWVL